MAAQQLLKERKFRAALEKLHEVDAISGLRKAENDALQTMRVIAAAGADEPTIAAKAYEVLSMAGSLSSAQKTSFAEAIAGAYFRTKDYRNAIVWANRCLGEGGNELRVKALLAQAYYFSDDYAAAAKDRRRNDRCRGTRGQTATEASFRS